MSTVTSPIIKDSTAQTIATKLDNINNTLGGNTNLAPIFNTSTAYSKGDMVNYNGDLYVFTANHAAGAWIGSDAVQTKVSTEISSLKSGLTSKIGVSSTTNLNDSWTMGIYTFAWNATGVPSEHSGTMLVMRIPNSDSGVQIARAATENTLYVRFFDSGVFTQWQTVTLGS